MNPSDFLEISALAEDDPAFNISGDESTPALLSAEERHFWHRSRNRIILSRLARLGITPGARFLELGCGAGCVASELARAGYEVTGVDGHRDLLRIARRRSPALRLWLHDLRRGTGELPARDFDAAGLFDVIEHLDDPAAALREALACVRPGGFVLGTVPALMALWSAVDEHSGHKLRYSAAHLRALLEGLSQATVIEITPFNRVLVPLLWAQRRWVGRRGDEASAVRNLGVPFAPVNRMLYALVMLEHRLAPILDKTPLGGASIWFALRREQ
jgi:SAM-dependent methyltransferase